MPHLSGREAPRYTNSPSPVPGTVIRDRKGGPFMLTITKEFHFHAAHRLYRSDLSEAENQEIFGACSKIHGHTYRLLVTLSGAVDDNGMILHFQSLKRIVTGEILDRYDHSDLNTLDEYRNLPPTAETMAANIFRILDPALTQRRFRLEAVTVYETPTARATVSRDA